MNTRHAFAGGLICRLLSGGSHKDSVTFFKSQIRKLAEM
jgi:hypothetical protein